MLDKNRNYGTVYGHPFIKYDQDGKMFNAGFLEIDPKTGESLEKQVVELKLTPEEAEVFCKGDPEYGPVETNQLVRRGRKVTIGG